MGGPIWLVSFIAPLDGQLQSLSELERLLPAREVGERLCLVGCGPIKERDGAGAGSYLRSSSV
jgi:hypothetical protein